MAKAVCWCHNLVGSSEYMQQQPFRRDFIKIKLVCLPSSRVVHASCAGKLVGRKFMFAVIMEFICTGLFTLFGNAAPAQYGAVGEYTCDTCHRSTRLCRHPGSRMCLTSKCQVAC